MIVLPSDALVGFVSANNAQSSNPDQKNTSTRQSQFIYTTLSTTNYTSPTCPNRQTGTSDHRLPYFLFQDH